MIGQPSTRLKCLICAGETTRAFDAVDTLHGLPGRFTVNVCKECGAGITLPLVDEGQLGEYYPNTYYTHERPSGLAGLISSFYNWRRMIRLGLWKMRPGRLLELGPGDCSFLLFLRRRGWEVVGVDPDAAVVENGRKAGLEILRGTAAQLPAKQFDVIVAWHSLEHSTNPLRDMQLLLDRLAPQGRLIVGVPDFGSRWAQTFGPAWHNLDVPRHRVHFTRRALQQLVAKSGGVLDTSRTWLSPHAVLESFKVRRKITLAGAAQSILSYILTPVCWALEAANAGDCVSISIRRGTSAASEGRSA